MSKTPSQPRIPAAPRSVAKGSALADLLDVETVECLTHNLALAHPRFDRGAFRRAALDGLATLAFEICERWAEDASAGRKWLIRHVVRHPAKHGVRAALRLRRLAAP